MGNVQRFDGISKKRRKVVAFGAGKERRLDMTPNGLVQSEPVRNLGKEIVYGRLTKDDHVVTVDRGTNNIAIRDIDTNQVLMNLKGKPEKPYGKISIKK